MSDFTPGLELNRVFYTEAAKPILDREFPAVPYSAALIGSIDQFSDNVDLRSSASLCVELRALYGEKLPGR